MSNAQHTPGPWAVVTRQILGCSDCRPVIVHKDPHPDFDDLAEVVVPDSQRDGGRDIVTAMANARLIAAAPELLKALRFLYREANASGLLDVEPSMQEARAAIAKATGEQ